MLPIYDTKTSYSYYLTECYIAKEWHWKNKSPNQMIWQFLFSLFNYSVCCQIKILRIFIQIICCQTQTLIIPTQIIQLYSMLLNLDIDHNPTHIVWKLYVAKLWYWQFLPDYSRAQCAAKFGHWHNSYSDYSSAQYVANLGHCQLLLRFFKHIRTLAISTYSNYLSVKYVAK